MLERATQETHPTCGEYLSQQARPSRSPKLDSQIDDPDPRKFRPPLRRATEEDNHRIAELTEIASEGRRSHTRRAGGGGGNFSYRNAVVAEESGEVVAIVLAYRLPEAAEEVNLEELPDLVRPLVELERLVPGTFHVNALAVLPGHRGQGLGSVLLNTADKLAW